MNYPESLTAIVQHAASEHRDNIDQAVDCAAKAWRATEERAEWLEQMELGQLRNLIHDARHQTNVAIRREAGAYAGPAKVGLSTGAANRVAQSILDGYVICGRVLGDILGKELVPFAKIELERAEGYQFNARLCRKLAAVVPDDKTVRQVLSESKIRKLMREARKPSRAKQAVA